CMRSHVSLCLLFFFQCYAAHRDLHSFPTRRSSDLRLRTGRLPVPELDWPGARRRGRAKMSSMTDAIALDVPHPLGSDRFESAGALALFGVAGALQFSIAAAQILLTIALICWVGLLVLRHERVEAPAFFWPLVIYGGATIVSAAF